MRKGKSKNFFPGGNTTQGFYSFFEYIPYNADRVFIIKGGPGTGKSTFMKRIGYEMMDKGYDIEFHWCASDNNSLDGVVIPALKVAIYDGTAPHMIDPVYPGAVEEIINLGGFWDSKYLFKHREEIIRLSQIINKKFQQVYHYLKIAKLIHDEWESYYLEGLNFDKANLKTEDLINKILQNKPITFSGAERHLFAGAITPEGSVNFLDNLTEDIKHRYIVKGKPGTGKSTMTKKIAKAILHRGYDVLYLHCSFDPDSVDNIIVPELDIAIIDGTAPHVIDAVRDGDQIVDMLECVTPEVIAQYAYDIEDVEIRFQEAMDKTLQTLKRAKLTHDQLEEFYIEAMDFNKVENKRKEIMKEILA